MADQIIAQGPQPRQGDESATGHIKVLAGVAGIGAAGFIKSGGGRVWDHYLRAIRSAETVFPGAILRTFRVSETLSPFETWGSVSFPSEQMAVGGKYAEFLRNRFGSEAQDISLIRTGSVFGEVHSGGRAVGMGLRIKAGTQQGTAIADYFARITGTNMPIKGIGSDTFTASLNKSLLKAEYLATRPPVPYGTWVEAMAPHLRTRDLIIGARFREKVRFLGMDIMLDEKMRRHVARVETFAQLMRARAAATAGRLNILLSKPLEIPVVGSILNKIPVVRSMAVKPGSALQMAGRYTGKALALGAMWKGLEYYDYVRSQGGVWSTALGTAGGAAVGGLMFKGIGRRFSAGGFAVGAGIGLYTALSPRFDKGLFYGAASIGTDINLARASLSERIGMTESLRRQDAITPGLISLKTALGFAGAGGLVGGMYQYGSLLRAAMAKHSKEGGNFADIVEGLREVRGKAFGEQLWGSKVGQALSKLPGGKFLSAKVKSPVLLGAAVGLAAWGVLSSGTALMSGNFAAAIPGLNLIGSKQTVEELQRVYSGEEEVPVRKGRWWEFGRSSGYEGGRIEYYRPHMLARLRERAYQKGIYGTEEERWEYDPTLHPMKALFGSDEWKYHYEITHQYDRPAPLTSTYGENVPFIGPLVASTFGKLVKPRKMVRPEEWNYGNGEYAYLPDIRGETEPAYELGGLGPGAPVSPEEPTQLINELVYRRREAVGLAGYAENVIQKAATGREEPFKNLQTMGTMGKETGGEYWLWKHLNVGGALGASEPVRRFIPHTRSYLDTYNPLANDMPSWIPRDYFADLGHGNPFAKVSEAEIRLPGPGYEALHPELKGVRPEDYPIAHRVKILGDVAMWSKDYEQALRKAKAQLNTLSDHDKSLVLTTESQVKAKKGSRREITPYRFRPELLQSKEVTISNIIDPRRIQAKEFGDAVIELEGFGAINNMQEAMEFAKNNLKGKVTLQLPAMESRQYRVGKNFSAIKAVAMLGDTDYGQVLAQRKLAQADELRGEFEQLRYTPTQKLAGRISEAALHNIESPLEMLTPISPAAKLIRQRSAIEEYIASEAIGTGNAFWDRPIENFLKPAANMALKKIGFDSLPEETVQRRDINEYFDMLSWVKAKQAERQAVQQGNLQAAVAAKTNQQETLFGLDLYGSPVNIMKALPRRERDFYDAFVNAPTEEERATIFALIPENEQRVYMGAWIRQEEETARAKKNAKIATLADEQTIIAAQAARATEGFGASDDTEAQWMKETSGSVPLDEWIREKKAAEYFATHSLPGADWLGWHPSVDMEDVKLKYIEMAGLDHHDFDLWDARKRSLARKPYISNDLINQMRARSNFDELMKTRANAKAMSKMHGGTRTTMSYIAAPIKERYDIEISDSRQGLIDDTYKQIGAR